MKETKKQKVERISYLVASSWLNTSERLLSRNDEAWLPGKLSDVSERGMMAMTGEYSMLLPWSLIRQTAVAMAKEMMFLFPEKYQLTIKHFTKK